MISGETRNDANNVYDSWQTEFGYICLRSITFQFHLIRQLTMPFLAALNNFVVVIFHNIYKSIPRSIMICTVNWPLSSHLAINCLYSQSF